MSNILEKAIELIQSAEKTNIKGKQYSTVATRIEVFRKTFGLDYGIQTEFIQSPYPEIVSVRAQITDPTGRILASGLAQENMNASKINQTSALENAETSAIGRALACLGLFGSEYSSSFELAYALQNQRLVEEGQYDPVPQDQQYIDHQPVDNQPVERPVINDLPSLYQPKSSHPDDVFPIYATIDTINDMNTLHAYYNSLIDLLPYMQEQDQVEIKQSFKIRNQQLQGQ